tara:strand:- start:192221 stop:192820 length:600 start_codon:yes stop_codon:yes gene_type:complete
MRILVVPKQDYLAAMKTLHSAKTLLDFVNRVGFYKEREEAEVDPNYLQIIPYILVSSGKGLFLYARLKKGNETRLHNKLSVGVGGHVDYVDDHLSNKEAVMYNANKELFEELNVELTGEYLDIKPTNEIIYDDTNEVGKVHLGLLMTCDASNRNITVKETEKIEGRFYSPAEIKALYKAEGEDAFETWTSIALKHVGII